MTAAAAAVIQRLGNTTYFRTEDQGSDNRVEGGQLPSEAVSGSRLNYLGIFHGKTC